MEQAQQKEAEALSVQSVPQQAVEQACFHPLRLISRNCEYLEQRLGRSGADAVSLQAVRDIGTEAARLERTLGEVLDLLEYLQDEEEPPMVPLDLRQLLGQFEAQADMIQSQLGVTLTLECKEGACRVLASQEDVQRLCLHLLSNALRACQPGGRVQLALCRRQDAWQLTVEDDGCGLPDSGGDAWVENRRSFLGGAQLGLLLCRESCRRMGWSLELQQASPRGTRAVVTIPLPGQQALEQEWDLCAGDANVVREQDHYRLRAMLVREMRTMPERWDPEEE